MCQLTYKQDWDLPGGVVEVGESPQLAVAREVAEELALDIPAGPLLLTDWLPPWGGWDDALCLVFDGGVHPASIAEQIVQQAREIRTAEFLTAAQVEERAADFTARRVGRCARRARRRAGVHRERVARSATSTPATISPPPASSPALGRWSSSTRPRAIATTGASSTHGTTAADGLRESRVLKMP